MTVWLWRWWLYFTAVVRTQLLVNADVIARSSLRYRCNTKHKHCYYIYCLLQQPVSQLSLLPRAELKLVVCILLSSWRQCGWLGWRYVCILHCRILLNATVTAAFKNLYKHYIYEGGFKKFCNSTVKKNGNVTNCILFFNIIPTEFKAFATFFWQTVNSAKIEIF